MLVGPHKQEFEHKYEAAQQTLVSFWQCKQPTSMLYSQPDEPVDSFAALGRAHPAASRPGRLKLRRPHEQRWNTNGCSGNWNTGVSARTLRVSFLPTASVSLPSITAMLPRRLAVALLCCSSCVFCVAARSYKPQRALVLAHPHHLAQDDVDSRYSRAIIKVDA